MNLSESCKKVAFVVGIDGARGTGDIEICESFQELNDYLRTINPTTETDLLVLHGIIASAKYIPAEIGNHIYLIVQDPDDPSCGCIYETDYPDSDDLAAMITGTIKGGDGYYKDIDINNISILYGYEMVTGYTVDEEEIDEEAFVQCINTAKHIKDVREKANGDIEISGHKTSTDDEEDALFTLYGSVVGTCE